jgi:hypothetical protein
MNKLVGIIEALDVRELKEIQKDLAEGNIGRLIKNRLDSIEQTRKDEKVCPTCGTHLTEEDARYILIFGPPDFRKRALFDEIDCLTFFIQKLNVQKEASH